MPGDQTPIELIQGINDEIVFLIKKLRYGTNTGSARKALEDKIKELEDQKKVIIKFLQNKKEQKGGKRKLKRKTMKSKSKKRTTRKH